MKKIPSVFQRNYETDRLIRDEVVPGCEWVLAGEGIATVKHDGTACLVKGGKIYARYDAKEGKAPPVGAIPCDPAPDPKTGHWPHWLEVMPVANQYRWHWEAWCDATAMGNELPEGTYELVGPKVQANPEKHPEHRLIRHGSRILEEIPRTFEGLKGVLSALVIEGIVFHHPDGRMTKVKAKDFGLEWPRG
jgi:hypothetical protein